MCCPSRHPAKAPLMAAHGSFVRTVFPSTCGQLRAASPGMCAVLAATVCPGSGVGLPPPARSAPGEARCPASHGSRTYGVPGISGRAAGSGPAGITLRRQGRAVARAVGPRHHRPRLRHEAHRRGPASAASNPTSSRMSRQTGMPVCAAVGGPVRAATLTRTLRGCTAPALRWAARRRSCPPSARQRARTAAALCPCSSFLSPLYPLTGALRIVAAPAWRRLCHSFHGFSAVFPPSLQAFVL